MTFSGRLSQSLFGISDQETTFAKRGFSCSDPAARQRLETAAQRFVYGYNCALYDSCCDTLIPHLLNVERDRQGFAFEGAAMGLAILDCFSPWKQRFQSYLQGSGNAHIYMVHVGIGWTFARLPGQYRRVFQQLDPLLRWLALDGYGFHEGFFAWKRTIEHHQVPRQLKDYALRAFDQGVGRSLWFVFGADGSSIAAAIATFPEQRRGDLWSGVGLACAYAGGSKDNLTLVQQVVGPYLPQLAQGVAFASKARQRAGNINAETEFACTLFCNRSSNDTAALTEQALLNLPSDEELPAYEIWRQRIQANFITAVTNA
jgi:Protein of unknown function (DUF1702).